MKPLILPKRAVLPAVRPSAALDAWYYATLARLLQSMGASLKLHLGAAWKEEPPEFGLAQDASNAVTMKRAMTKWGNLWVSKFDRMSDEVARKFADRSRQHVDYNNAQIFKKVGFTLAFQTTPPMREAYQQVIGWNVGLIRNLPRRYVAGIQDAVWSSVMKGADLDELNRTLREQYHMSLRRAALISKDQNSKARAVMNQARHAELGIEFGVWQHSHAVRHPRPSHLAFDGKVFNLKKGVVLDGERVWPGTAINCQCGYRPIIAGFNDEEIAQARRAAVRSRA